MGGEGYIPTVEQKQDMVHRLQNQYAEHVATSASGNDIYKSLADTYAAGASAWMTPSATATMHLTTPNDAAAVENALQDFSQQPESGKTFRPLDGSFSGSLSPRSALSPVACKSGSGKLVNEIDDDFDHGNPMLRVKTNVDLLESLDQSTMESDNEVKLSTFMKTLNAEDADKNTRTSQFRKRRLTYSQRVYGANEAVEPDRRERTKRTSIYASTEIGVRQEKVPPFPDNYMGTFSCHGIEPGDNDEVYDKINQDRGCVVYPYNSSMTECLFIVLDGHGEQGDKVSEFVMRQVVISLEKHSHILMDPSVALVETFVKTNKALQATEINFMTSGCTCVAAYITGSMMYVANCGDSRAVMARGSKALDSLKAAELSRDHKPDDPLEFERITSMGGFVQPAPEPGLTARVYLDASHTMIGLAMARSIGTSILFPISPAILLFY